MANVVVTMRIMPESPSTDLEKIKKAAQKHIREFCDETEFKEEILPIAFGLNALQITFVMNEELGSTEELEDQIKKVQGVQSVEVLDVRRAIG